MEDHEIREQIEEMFEMLPIENRSDIDGFILILVSNDTVGINMSKSLLEMDINQKITVITHLIMKMELDLSAMLRLME